jgi:hypothetical protein
MRRIFKYSLPPVGEAALGMHGDPRPLGVGWQGRQLVMWAEVDDDRAARIRAFTVVMTGDPVPDGEYIGSVQRVDDGQPYVVHVYRQAAR